MAAMWFVARALPLLLVLVAWLRSAEAILSTAATVSSFEAFVARYGREYERGSPEYAERHAIFLERFAAIRAQNAKPDRLWTAAISSLSDRSDAELRQLRGYRRSRSDSGESGGSSLLLQEKTEHHRRPLAQVDWRHLHALRDVPNQGPCGSCWAVTTSTILGARHEIHRVANRSFSVQQLVNCVSNPRKCGGNGGCDGATVELALEYVLRQGLSDAMEVPYVGRDDSCQDAAPASAFASGEIGAERAGHQKAGAAARRLGITGFQRLPENKAWPLMQALSEGPVGVSVAASDWSLYGNGVFNDCSKDAVIDHAVTLAGYGQIPGTKVKYWTIQNSWGSDWGERGYIRLFRHNTPRDDDAYCGTDNDPKAGTACEPYPTAVRVCGMCGILYDSSLPHFSSLAAPAAASKAEAKHAAALIAEHPAAAAPAGAQPAKPAKAASSSSAAAPAADAAAGAATAVRRAARAARRSKAAFFGSRVQRSYRHKRGQGRQHQQQQKKQQQKKQQQRKQQKHQKQRVERHGDAEMAKSKFDKTDRLSDLP